MCSVRRNTVSQMSDAGPGPRHAKAWFAAQGGDVVGYEPEAFAAVVRADHPRSGKVIREAVIAAE